MKLSTFSALFAFVLMTACGSEQGVSSSRVFERQGTIQPQGDPDYKNKDGVELMTWVKRPEVRKAICGVLNDARNQGHKAYSDVAYAMVAKTFELHPVEAEIVATYSLEMQCPELN